jgi:hypothetical protein
MFFSRGPNKAKNPYVMKDFYEYYISEVDDPDGPYYVDYHTFRDICEEFYKALMDYIFEGGLYILPYNVGELSINGKRVKKLTKYTMPIDWDNTNKLGKKVYHINDHSDYYKYRFTWSKINRHVKHKNDYKLVFTRDNKRRLAKIIKSGDYNYFTND